MAPWETGTWPTGQPADIPTGQPAGTRGWPGLMTDHSPITQGHFGQHYPAGCGDTHTQDRFYYKSFLRPHVASMPISSCTCICDHFQQLPRIDIEHAQHGSYSASIITWSNLHRTNIVLSRIQHRDHVQVQLQPGESMSMNVTYTEILVTYPNSFAGA
jgi:hypothetical protein